MAFNLDGIIIETEMEAIKNDLLRKSTKGDWKGVIDIYKKHPEAHAAKLTINEDTALHIVVSSDREETVEQLMNIISRHHGEGQQIPEFKNERGNTPLHVAASMGSVTLCKSVVNETTGQLGLSFMEARNFKGETPLFMAVLSGKKEVFIFLHKVYQENNLSYNDLSCRNDDDDTILHVAIATKCFDLALEIITLYPKLVHFVNNKGFSPLHVLANEPSAFESATMYGFVVTHLAKCFPRIKSLIRAIQDQENAAKVMNELVERIAAPYEQADGGTDPNKTIRSPEMAEDPKQKTPIIGSTSEKGSMATSEAPILIAAKNGIIKMIEKILEIFPEAVYEVDSKKKNIVLLSVEHKQPRVYKLLLQKKQEKNIIHDSMFWEVDNEGNTALHLAAKKGSSDSWPVPGAALQMNWEIKWFENVKASLPNGFLFIRNNVGETPEEVFTKSHKELVQEGGKWLTDISNMACPVATGVFVAIAFSSSPNVDVKTLDTNMLESFEDFSIASLLASCLSVIAVTIFILVITLSRSERSFRTGLSTLSLLLSGLAACHMSAMAALAYFVDGHFFLGPERCEFTRKYGAIVYSAVYLTLFMMSPYISVFIAFIFGPARPNKTTRQDGKTRLDTFRSC
ncbi:uncharacterized protein LOC121263505 [Juglans microcarpa x Juglans regia]|uniref:uncharacterized protein LOC121263505 n=1 Tax=Juglans microcarpa x Juglans regia TaxID=2249226 RepID=UPI001B7DC1A3|nr:uncharacterized protein LOC121263505 [Juglans microcarpa x Juglans regia]